ncbi:MAG: hypothetical protein AB1646_16280 [Thermodesulfobacteriota bacterium]
MKEPPNPGDVIDRIPAPSPRAPRELPSWLSAKGLMIPVAVVIVGILVLKFMAGLYSTVPKGKYQIKQTWIIGTVDAKMTPGFWFTFGEVSEWPKAETFYFTADPKEGKSEDQSIEVRYNDGSLTRASGTCRVVMPKTREQAIALVTERGYKDFNDLEVKLILPVVRNALRATANLMSARESYSEKRLDYIQWSWDQVVHGLYETEETLKQTKDPITGEVVTKRVKVIKKDKDGHPVRQQNPLRNTGVTLDNFEIKQFVYDKVVRDQISSQQQAYMSVETARANAAKAEQDALTMEAQGKAKVMEAKYQEEMDKVRAVVKAQKDKEVAEIAAQRQLQVAKLERQAAEQKKQSEILLAEGESKARELKMKADNYEAIKIDAWKEAQFRWADAFSKRKVPQIIFGSAGGGAGDQDSTSLGTKNLLDVMILNSLGINMGLGQPKPAK